MTNKEFFRLRQFERAKKQHNIHKFNRVQGRGKVKSLSKGVGILYKTFDIVHDVQLETVFVNHK